MFEDYDYEGIHYDPSDDGKLASKGVWVNKAGERIPICTIDVRYACNLMNFLIRACKGHHARMVSAYSSCVEPTGEMAQMAFELECEHVLESTWQSVLRGQSIFPHLVSRYEELGLTVPECVWEE
jgi:hypothetical protein